FDGAPVAVIVGSDVHYVHTDHLGTPRAITDSGVVIWRWESDPFGATAAQEDPDGDLVDFTYNLRFPGQYYDDETGLHYNYFRTYDPSTGRYLESDPIGLAAGPNTYAYADGAPNLYSDPLGLQIVPIYPLPIPPAAAPDSPVYQYGSPANEAAGAALAEACKDVWEWNKAMTLFALYLASGPQRYWGALAEPPRDARDPDGAKAPGKPGEDEGFEDPKGGEDWVPNPNGRGNGWLDADGNVWVPTGPGGEAHGGPHWDVQKPGRGYVNVYPGGRRR
ncbi:MAG: RHS repeat-associated core domain-containing protein, partial [Pseudomonadota bacterium]